MLWIKYSSCLHWIVLNYFKVPDGFFLDTFYSNLMYRDLGRKLLGKFMEFLSFNIHRLREIFLFVQTKEPIRTHHYLILTSIKVSVDKMTNYLGPQIGNTSLNYCVRVLFRVIRSAKRENILLDGVKWVVQLNNYKHDIRNSERSFPYSFRRIRRGDSQSIKERGLCYNFWFISRYSLN